MSPRQTGPTVESKAAAEALIPLFEIQKVLNQDQNGRRITVLGTIKDEQALFTLERAAFPSSSTAVSTFISGLSNTTNLGANDVYRWYMSNHIASPHQTTSEPSVPDLKLNLIYPCTETHIRKYTSQSLRYVTESARIYNDYVKPWIERTQRTPKRLDWIYNILDGITEQEDVIYRSPDFVHDYTTKSAATSPSPTGFLLLPDLNWDRKTLTSLHLLALVQRRDIRSLRDLRRSHVPWLKEMLSQIQTAAAKRGTELAAANGSTDVMEPDQVKCYVHYQPTYYHFHIHVVHVMLEPEGGTQSIGKAFGLETLIAWLEGIEWKEGVGHEPGLDQVDVTYHLGEASDLWTKLFARIKNGVVVDLLD